MTTDSPKPSGRVRKRAAKKMTLDQVPEEISDLARMSVEIPDDVRIAIADVVMSFAAMETTAEHLIWELSGVSFDDGKLLTRMEAKAKLDLARKFIERYNLLKGHDKEKIVAFWRTIHFLVELRNKVAHGLWWMLDKKIPLCASYRMASGEGQVTAEAFPLERLRYITEENSRAKTNFDSMVKHVQSSPPKPSSPHGRLRPTLPPHLVTTSK